MKGDVEGGENDFSQNDEEQESISTDVDVNDPHFSEQ